MKRSDQYLAITRSAEAVVDAGAHDVVGEARVEGSWRAYRRRAQPIVVAKVPVAPADIHVEIFEAWRSRRCRRAGHRLRHGAVCRAHPRYPPIQLVGISAAGPSPRKRRWRTAAPSASRQRRRRPRNVPIHQAYLRSEAGRETAGPGNTATTPEGGVQIADRRRVNDRSAAGRALEIRPTRAISRCIDGLSGRVSRSGRA